MFRLIGILSLSMFCLFHTQAQTSVYGIVRKNDANNSPIYQAKVTVFDGTDSLTTLKTYFDGSFKFPVAKDKIYTLVITHPGYRDTTVSILADKKGIPTPQNIAVTLIKDGMRLMGTINSKSEDFPITDAGIILKNILTRQEKRVYTGIDGAYNFKLDYETNYRLTVDKRSLGIFNRYKDTSLYLSTIGFNQPFDYRLNIYLDDLENPVADAVPPTERRVNDQAEPTTWANNPVKPSEISPPKPKEDVLASLPSGNKKETSSSGLKTGGGAKSKKKDEANNSGADVVMFDEKTKTTSSAYSTAVKQAEQNALEIEARIAQKRQEQLKKAEVLAAMQQAYEDSIQRTKELEDNRAIEAALQQKPVTPPTESVAQKLEKLKAEIASRQKAEEDSVAIEKAAAMRKAEEQAAILAEQREEKERAEVARKKYVADSIANERYIALKQEEDARKRQAEREALAQLRNDSVARKREADNFKKQETVTAKLRREIAARDSIFQLELKLLYANREAQEKKKREDSLARVKAQEELVAREAEKARIAELAAFEQEKIKAEKEATIAKERERARQESIAAATLERARIEREAQALRLVEDSIALAASEIQRKFEKDSMAKVAAAMEELKQEVKRKAKEEEEIKRAQEAEFAALEKKRAEETAKLQAEKEAAIRAAADKARRDSLTAAKADQMLRAAELKAKREALDSIKKEREARATLSFQDSLMALKAEQARIQSELIAKEQRQKQELENKKIFVKDSIAKARAQAIAKAKQAKEEEKLEQAREKERLAYEKEKKGIEEETAKLNEEKEKQLRAELAKLQAISAKKLIQDSIDKALALEEQKVAEANAKAELDRARQQQLEAARQQLVEDSLLREQQLQNKRNAELAELKRLADIAEATRIKFVEDSLAREAAERTNKAYNDSVASAKANLDKLAKELAEIKKRAKQDSIARAKAEEERLKNEALLNAAFKARQDSISRAIAEQERIARMLDEKRKREEAAVLAAQRAYNDSIEKMKREFEALQNEIGGAKFNQQLEAQARSTEEKALQNSAKEAKLLEQTGNQNVSNAEKEQQNEIEKISQLREAEARKIFEEQQALKGKEAENESIRLKNELEAREKALNQIRMAAAQQEAEKKAAAEAQKAWQESLKKTESKERNQSENTPSVSESTQIIPEDLPTLFFAQNDFALSASAKSELDMLTTMMKSDENKRVRLYAIASGEEASGRTLSLKRSDAVLRYLVKQGIAIERIQSYYFGSEKSRNGCVNENCPEDLLKQNRTISWETYEY